jgi:hypothetical protein
VIVVSVVSILGGVFAGLLSQKFFYGRLVKLYFIIAPLSLFLDVAILLYFTLIWTKPDIAVDLPILLCSICMTCILNSISSYGFIVDVAKIELLTGRKRIFAIIFGILSSIQVLFPTFFINPLFIFFAYNRWFFLGG